MPPGKRIRKKFNAEGPDYDYETAHKAGVRPDKTGHLPSREPKSGMILKGRGHKTWALTAAAEKREGYKIYKRHGRYFSKKVK